VSNDHPALFSVQPAVSPTGTLTYTLVPGTSGVAIVTVRLQDDGGTAHGGVDTSVTQQSTITVQSQPDAIFADSFESRSFAAWSGVRDAERDLSVTAAAALVGRFGMAALIDDNAAMWVRSDTPDNERRYRVRFYFDPNGIPITKGNAFPIMAARSGKLNTGADVARVELRRLNSRYQVRAAIATDAGTFARTAWSTIPNGRIAIEIDWQTATAAGANNGGLSLWTGGTFRHTVSGIDNDTLRVNSVRLGALQGIDFSTRGTVFFDGFVSRRTTFIGR
jgi:hypothetical protein